MTTSQPDVIQRPKRDVATRAKRERKASAGRSGKGRRGTVALVLGLAALFATIVVPLVYRASWADAIYPGVYVEGRHVGGLPVGDAAAMLGDDGLSPDSSVYLVADDSRWPLSADAVGVNLDRTVADAHALGRSGSRPERIAEMSSLRLRPRSMPLVLHYDEAATRSAIAAIAAELERSPVDASLTIEGTTVHTVASATGRTVLVEPAVALVREAVARGAWPIEPIPLPIDDVQPAIRSVDGVAGQVRHLVADAIEFRAFNHSWSIAPAELAPLLLPRAQGESIRLDVARDGFGRLMSDITQTITRSAETPRFHFDTENRSLIVTEPGVTGRSVNIDRTIDRLLELHSGGQRTVHVAVDFVTPDIDETVTAADLGIVELLHEETSHFVGSSADRVHNIGVSAKRFDGVMIPPGEVFSFNDAIGDITTETGYRKTLIILDGATADGIGGGVCQVSTTLFRAAFWTGMPIVERLAHGYRVAYYEQHSPTGLDATVYRPIVDLKFQNDTDHYVLIETETNSARSTVTFRMYGTKPDREVTMEGPVVHSRTPPPAGRTVVDPTLAPGQSRTDELSREGMSVSVRRHVTTNGEVRTDVFNSNYRPTAALTVVGPSVAEPEPEQVSSATP